MFKSLEFVVGALLSLLYLYTSKQSSPCRLLHVCSSPYLQSVWATILGCYLPSPHFDLPYTTSSSSLLLSLTLIDGRVEQRQSSENREVLWFVIDSAGQMKDLHKLHRCKMVGHFLIETIRKLLNFAFWMQMNDTKNQCKDLHILYVFLKLWISHENSTTTGTLPHRH